MINNPFVIISNYKHYNIISLNFSLMWIKNGLKNGLSFTLFFDEKKHPFLYFSLKSQKPYELYENPVISSLNLTKNLTNNLTNLTKNRNKFVTKRRKI